MDWDKYAAKWRADGHAGEAPTDEALRVAFAGCAFTPRQPLHLAKIRAAIRAAERGDKVTHRIDADGATITCDEAKVDPPGNGDYLDAFLIRTLARERAGLSFPERIVRLHVDRFNSRLFGPEGRVYYADGTVSWFSYPGGFKHSGRYHDAEAVVA